MPKRISSPPAEPGGGERLEDRPGSAAARLVGLLGQRAGRVEAVEDVRGHQRRGQERAQIAPGPGRRHGLASRTRSPGPRRIFAASSTIKSVTPTSSAITPTLLIRAISRTPTTLIAVVSADQQAAEEHGVPGAIRPDGRITDQLKHRRDLRQRGLEAPARRRPG